ncbi:MAG: exodeoxyribonuclease V subunit gamma [Oligoflexia bacterium]|nr:exodeoxyribonuclease V subunit gamma [Oligoflexia bacterium]
MNFIENEKKNWDFWSKLNQTQTEAVTQVDGPIMILAGAGSGKTRTLVAKVLYLLEYAKVRPWQILVLTFSNKAAKEAKERVLKLTSNNTDSSPNSITVSTFHSFCARVLRSEFNYLGMGSNFTIYDESESKSVMNAVFEKRRINAKENSPSAVLSYIDELKNTGYYVGRKNTQNISNTLLTSPLHYLFTDYENELAVSNAVDFGGLLTGVLKLFELFPEALTRYQHKYRYVLIDEYQDTNRAQFDLVVNLASISRNICVVGDEDQSIYSWRGACIDNILDFSKVYPDAKIFKLEQNYRSTQTIINAAAKVVSCNTLRSDKKIWTKNNSGELIQLVACNSDYAEGEFVAKEVKSIISRGVPLQEIAIFYRNNSQSRIIEESFIRAHIPYQVIGGIKFYERKEIKDILSYLKLAVNPKDSVSLVRALGSPPRGVGAVTLRKLEEIANANNISLWEAIQQEVLSHSSKISLSSKAKNSLSNFIQLIKSVQEMDLGGQSPSHCYKKLLTESGMIEYLKAEKTHESQARIDNLQELTSAITYFENSQNSLGIAPTISNFLEGITLVQTSMEENQASNINTAAAEATKNEKVSLMTIHSSKGLEFPYVFLISAEENIFPPYKTLELMNAKNSDAAFSAATKILEEERRLFYVAMTRAMTKLYISYSSDRLLFGTVRKNDPSRFIKEIPKNFCQNLCFKGSGGPNFNFNANSAGASTSTNIRQGSRINRFSSSATNNTFNNKNTSAFSSSLSEKSLLENSQQSKFKKNLFVKHSVYGNGVVLQIEGNGEDEKIWIEFSNGTKKQFMSKSTAITVIKH